MSKLSKFILIISSVFLAWILTSINITDRNFHLIEKSSVAKTNQNSYKLINFKPQLGLPNNVVILQIFEDNQNNLWLAARFNGLWEQAVGQTKFQQNNILNKEYMIDTIFQDKDLNLWVGTYRHGLWEKVHGQTMFVQNSVLGDDVSINKIFEDFAGNLWGVTTYHGIWEKTVRVSTFKQNSVLNSHYSVTSFFQDNDFNIWAGTSEHGLWEQKSGATTFTQDSVIVNYLGIQSIFQDNAGNLWVGTYNGLWEKKYEKLTFEQNIYLADDTYVNDIFQDQEKNLWVGTSNRGLYEQTVGQVAFKHNTILGNYVIRNIFQQRDHSLWVSTWKHGLWEQATGKTTFVQNTVLGKSCEVHSIFQDSDDNLWAGASLTDASLPRVGIWKKLSKGIYINPTEGLHTYIAPNKIEYFQDPFSVTVNEPDVDSIRIGKVTHTDIDLRKPINFPSKIYQTTTNQTFLFQVNFTIDSGKPKYVNHFCIKPTYLDNGNSGQDSLKDSLTSIGGQGLTSENVYLKGDQNSNVYQLLIDLAKDKATNPTLKIFPSKFNFLTNYSQTWYAPITITNGIIKLGKSTRFTKKETVEILGSKTRNLYEVVAVDYLGNATTFLIQEGGVKLNPNFTTTPYVPPKPPAVIVKHRTWTYVGIALIIIDVLLLSSVGVHLWLLRRSARNLNLVANLSEKNKKIALKKNFVRKQLLPKKTLTHRQKD